MLGSLLFVGRTKGSKPYVDTTDRPAVLDCAERLKTRDITGAIIIAGELAAQVIEGEHDELTIARQDCQPACIETGAKLVLSEDIGKRRFKDWSLVYSGTTDYVQMRIKALLDDGLDEGERNQIAKDLIQIMVEFADDA